jgi:hypothetical protein
MSATTFSEVLANEEERTVIIDECCAIIDAEVKEKTGLTGLTLKAGLGALNMVKPNFVRQAVTNHLPEFARALEPSLEDARSQHKTIEHFLLENSSSVADALLAITDARAAQLGGGIYKATYEKLRGSAKKNVELAMPRVARMVQKHTPG